MDISPSEAQQATASSSSGNLPPQDPPSHEDPSPSTSTRTLRSSARVKAAKEKGKQREQSIEASTESATRNTRSSTQASKRLRDPQPKGKGKQTDEASTARPAKKTRRPVQQPQQPVTAAGLTINEPSRDTKGKKRAAPDPSSDDDSTPTLSSKRTKTASTSTSTTTVPYPLRSRTDASIPTDMPKKTSRQMSAKGKAVASPSKSKPIPPSPGPSRLHGEDEDFDMMDPGIVQDGHDDQMEGIAADLVGGENDDDDESRDVGDEGDHDCDDPSERDVLGSGGAGLDEPRGFAGLDEASAMALFSNYHNLGSYMVSLSGRLKTMLNNIKLTADPTTRLLTLQELSELLSISTEDTLAGSFPINSFVRVLIQILGGSGKPVGEDDDGDDDDVGDEQDEDAALAAAIALSGGSQYAGDENLEAQVLAARCLANLMEALPGIASTVSYHGAIPVLCSKLTEISYIDLAEQVLSTLEKISEDAPDNIVREGGLAALLTYLDFFSIAVQRTALQAAANCCRNIKLEHFAMVTGVWPVIRTCLGYSDQRLVEFACLSVIRVIDSYRSSPEKLEALVDSELIHAVNILLLPAGGSPLIASNTYTLLLRALASSARASPKITVALLEDGMVDTLYQILTGVLPSSQKHERDEQGGSSGGQGLGGGLADMAVMQNLAHRPKDQVEEALSLISELLPPLPKDGVFDHKAYTEKALARMVKAKAKAERAAQRQANLNQVNMLIGMPPPSTPSSSNVPSEAPTPPATEQEPEELSAATQTKDSRTDVLRSKAEVVSHFMALMVPILVDVYAASVTTTIRIKTLTGLLKAISFLEPEGVKQVLSFVPVASFASSILSSKDHPTLVIGALQLVELLLNKAPAHYKPAFRREGVFHEIETLAARTLINSKLKDKEPVDVSTSNEPPPPAPTPAAPLATSLPGYKKLSQLAIDPEDAVTLRSRVIRLNHLSSKESDEGDNVLLSLRKLVERLSKPKASEKESAATLRDLAALFASPHSSVSSFELLQSGVVDSLLSFATDKDRNVSVDRRQELLLDAFTSQKPKSGNDSSTAFTVFVKKLQESLTRMENFDVVTVTQSIDGPSHRTPSLLARQLRLRLVAAEESDIPRNLSNIVVSIHAIATFQALHDYLRPRVSGTLVGGSRLSGMLAALAAGANRASTSGLASGSISAPPPLPSDAVPPPPQASTSSASAPSAVPIERRRSQRLKAKDGASSTSEDSITDAPPVAGPSGDAIPSAAPEGSEAAPSAGGETAPSDTIVNDDPDYGDFTDEDVDAEVFDDEMDADNSVTEKTVNLSVAADGSKIEAQTPDGTRVGTPAASSSREPPATPTPRPSSSRNSYAAALKTKPQDWHLEFSMDDHVLPLDLTIYGAIHQQEQRKKAAGTGSSVPSHLLWQGVYTIKFKKVPGPASSADQSEASELARSRPPTPPLLSLSDDASHSRILRLLRVLSRLNTLQMERNRPALPDSAFVNNKLTAKLTRQLEEPMIVASQCLPNWALDLPQHFPFLFPFATRYNFLQSTSFGYARLILKWQSQQSRTQDSSSRRDDGVGFLGRLQRQKVRISRNHILESAMKVFELYGSSSSILEVEYFEEVGTGLGPTLEFYSLASKEFARKDLKVWRDEDAMRVGPHVFHPRGLFPAPISAEEIASDGGQKKTHVMHVIGRFVAKALLDSRIIDLSFNKVFLRLAMGEDVPLTIAGLKAVDIELAASLEKLRDMANEPRPLFDKFTKRSQDQVKIEDLALDFTLPGYEAIELRPGGKDIAVTSENVEEYIRDVLNAIIGTGAKLQAKAFRDGFNKVFPIQDLQAFTTDELLMLFGNSEEDWSTETLSEALKADHGFNVDSRAIRDLVEILASYDATSRRSFLQFITGSPKLPIGGFRGLQPALTVVRKPSEAPLTADDYLPSVMTCVNYLKLPDYSSKAVMAERLRVAMQEGGGSFHLS